MPRMIAFVAFLHLVTSLPVIVDPRLEEIEVETDQRSQLIKFPIDRIYEINGLSQKSHSANDEQPRTYSQQGINYSNATQNSEKVSNSKDSMFVFHPTGFRMISLNSSEVIRMSPIQKPLATFDSDVVNSTEVEQELFIPNNLIDDLLSPSITTYSHLKVVSNFIFVVRNHLIVHVIAEVNDEDEYTVNQDSTQSQTTLPSRAFETKHTYRLSKLTAHDKIKTFPLKDKVFIVSEALRKPSQQKKIKSTVKHCIMYLVHVEECWQVSNNHMKHIEHLSEVTINGVNSNGTIPGSVETFILAAEGRYGLAIYQLDQADKRLVQVHRLLWIDFQAAKQINIIDFTAQQLSNRTVRLRVLDRELGLMELKYSFTTSQVIGNVTNLLRLPNCQSFTEIDETRITAICHSGGSTIMKDIFVTTNSSQLSVAPPIFIAGQMAEVIIADPFYFLYTQSSLHLLINPDEGSSQGKGMLKVQMPGLQTFQIYRSLNSDATYLYSVREGRLFKELIMEEPYQLYVLASKPILKPISLQVKTSCILLRQTLKIPKGAQKYKSDQCIYKKQLLLRVRSPQSLRTQLGINAGLIIVLIIAMLVMIWVCLIKYKGIEKVARQAMRSIQNSQRRILVQDSVRQISARGSEIVNIQNATK